MNDGFYQTGMRLLPHPDVPGIGGIVTYADAIWVRILWDDGDVDQYRQTSAEEPDLRVAPDINKEENS